MNNEQKVFCIGLGRTGTTTFGKCMKTLGYKHVTGPILKGLALARINKSRLFRVIDNHNSFADYPWPYLYETLHKRYPSALFILTTRSSPQAWFDSLLKHSDRRGPTEAHLLAYGCYTPHSYEQDLKDLYESHNKKVRDYFSGSSNFIEICWEQGDSWERLCSFLGCPQPQERNIPHENSAKKDPLDVVARLCEDGKYGTAIYFADKYMPEKSEPLEIVSSSIDSNLGEKLCPRSGLAYLAKKVVKKTFHKAKYICSRFFANKASYPRSR